MSYYRAKLEDFFIGSVYNQRIGDVGNWRASILSEAHFTLTGNHYHFLEVLINLKRFEDRKPFYKIKHLDVEDIKSFGFIDAKKDEIGFVESGDSQILKYGKFYILFYKDSGRVDIYEELSRSDSSDLDKLFTGQVLDIMELKRLLMQVGILYNETRKNKFKERV